MKVITKCKINSLSDLHKSVTDRRTEGQTDGWACSFCGGELITIVVIDIG